MELYTFLRYLADSWALLAMALFFLGTCLWAFRPGSRAKHQEVASSIFRHDDRPGDPRSADPTPARPATAKPNAAKKEGKRDVRQADQ